MLIQENFLLGKKSTVSANSSAPEELPALSWSICLSVQLGSREHPSPMKKREYSEE